jgi:hypothetical protein
MQSNALQFGEDFMMPKSSVTPGLCVDDFVLQKRAKAGGNLRFGVKVRQVVRLRVSFSFGISVAFGLHPQHALYP